MSITACTPRLALAALLLSGAAMPVRAETLQEALAAAYRDNPTLTAARAGQQATDENVNVSLAQGRPTAQLQSQFSELAYRDPVNDAIARRTLGITAQITAPIYSGGRVRNGIEAAERRIESGQFNLKGTELTVFSRVVAAYMDVIRNQSVVSLSQNNVQRLDVNLKATRDRFEVGDLTRTDVAQSEARLALARSDLKSAESQLISARETYIQVVGHEPVDLQPPPPLPGLPENPEVAVDVALANNPDLAAARKTREAAQKDVQVAQGARLPTVSTFATGSLQTDLKSTPSTAIFNQYPKSLNVGANITIPLYQGGGPGAQVRRTRALESQAIEQMTATERNVVAQTRSLYASWQASNQVIESTNVAVSSNALSLQGVRAENSVGTRTILDILNAEQENFSAQVQLVTAQRNAYVAGFSLLAAMGKATAGDLGLGDGVALYDPVAHYDAVHGKLSDWSGGSEPAPIAARTVDSPTQNATVKDSISATNTP
jgi:outer membrane protein